MLNKIGFVAIFLLSLSSFAQAQGSFVGTWSGTGELQQKGSPISGGISQTSFCDNITVTVEQWGDRMNIKTYHGACGQLVSDWGPYEMKFVGGKVISPDDEEIGTFDGTSLLTSEARSSVIYDFNLELTPEGKLKALYGVRNMVGAMIMVGELTRSP